MRLLKVIAAGALIAGLSMTSAMADYNVGFRYYSKFIKSKAHLKAPKMMKILNVQTIDELKGLFKDNGKGLIAKLNAAGEKKAAKGVEKIIKKHKLKDLEDFLIGIMQGNIPAGCS